MHLSSGLRQDTLSFTVVFVKGGLSSTNTYSMHNFDTRHISFFQELQQGVIWCDEEDKDRESGSRTVISSRLRSGRNFKEGSVRQGIFSMVWIIGHGLVDIRASSKHNTDNVGSQPARWFKQRTLRLTCSDKSQKSPSQMAVIYMCRSGPPQKRKTCIYVVLIITAASGIAARVSSKSSFLVKLLGLRVIESEKKGPIRSIVEKIGHSGQASVYFQHE